MSAPKIHSKSVDQAGGTTAVLVAGVSGKVIQVMGILLSVSGAACTVKSTLQDETANTVRATLVGNATQPVVYPYRADSDNDKPLFEVLVGDGLELTTGTAAAISGVIQYRYV